jgi:hypothetical protein
MTQTIENLIAIAYPGDALPPFEHTDQHRKEFSRAASQWRKEHARMFDYLTELRAGVAQREAEAAAIVLNVRELITLPADELARRCALNNALGVAVEVLELEITAAEEALAAFDARINAAEDLACLAALPKGSTPADLAAHRERQAAELASIERERKERQDAEAALRQAELDAEFARIEAMSLTDLLQFLFSNPWPYMTAALVHGQKAGEFNRNNFSETEETLRDYFDQHRTGAKRRALERLWERYEEVAFKAIYKQYPAPRLALASAIGGK